MKPQGWRVRQLLGVLINGGGLLVLLDQALTQVLR
jgi:hypothetical protein